MSAAEDPSVPEQNRVPVHPVLWIMIAVMAGFEVMFACVAAGWLPEALGRWPVFLELAFFDLVFEYVRSGHGIEPQLFWSLLTHAFLHGNWLHLVLNGAVFLALGHALVQGIGIGRFLIIFAVTAISGALMFGFLADTRGPMVGASGAVFGMFAAITAWQERAMRMAGVSRAPIWRRIAGLAALNVALAFALQGLLAWEAHLGGWIAGWLMAAVFRPRFGRIRVLRG